MKQLRRDLDHVTRQRDQANFDLTMLQESMSEQREESSRKVKKLIGSCESRDMPCQSHDKPYESHVLCRAVLTLIQDRERVLNTVGLIFYFPSLVFSASRWSDGADRVQEPNCTGKE